MREAATKPCLCATQNEGGGYDGMCYALMKDLLVKNKLDGEFQEQVARALRDGRGKDACLFTLGPSDCGKILG